MPTSLPAHVPVLLSAVLDGLHLTPGALVIDATLGGGGHARAMLEATAPTGRVLGIEADERTLQQTQQELATYTSRFIAAHGNFRELRRIATDAGFNGVDAILFDLGVSSMTIEDPQRGFSFQHNGPLDMRFSPKQQTQTAADIVNTWSVRDLIDIFRRYGNEPVAERIAAAIVSHRSTNALSMTTELADVISRVKHRRGRIHPATQVFQALRIAVNDEYGAIEVAMPQALELLKYGGRLAMITFHSGEDRLVKAWMKGQEKLGTLHLETKHVIVPLRDEQIANPRSRSAKLRIITKQTNT